MKRCEDAESFLAGGPGHYVVLHSIAYWRFDERLWGMTVWGSPSARDVEQLVTVLELETRAVVPPYASLLDFRRLETVDLSAFSVWMEYSRVHREEQAKKITHEVLVRPTNGLVAAVLAGYSDIAKPLHRFDTETDITKALERLGRTDADAVNASVEAALSREREDGNVLDRLRRVLRARLESTTLDEVAGELGLSSRSLQRMLQSASTTFGDVLNEVRVSAAQERMLTTNEKLSVIAQEVGFATQQHFSTVFSRTTGMTPREWRDRHRKA